MQRIRVPFYSFQFGEVSESMLMRVDTSVYQSSAQRIENMTLRSEGGVTRRFGTKNLYSFSDTAYNSAKTMQSKLSQFIFSDDERYIVSIENAKLRVFQVTATGATLASTLTQDVDTDALPFDDDYLHEYSTSQYGDVMVICHPLFLPRLLVRTGLTTFEVQKFSFTQRSDGNLIYQPYSAFQAASTTLNPSATTGSGVTLVTSAAYFDTTGSLTGPDYLSSLHVGVVLRYDQSEITITSVQSATSATGTVTGTLRVRLEILDPLRTRGSSTSVEVTHLAHGFAGSESITLENAAATGGISAANLNGARTISSIIDANTYVITAGASATDAEDGGGIISLVTHAPTTRWSEQSFSAKRGYPAAVVFHEGRLVFGGTIDQPDSVWMSKSSQFFNFDVGAAADSDSIQITIATGEVNQIRYLISNRDLQVFTASSELYVPSYLNQVITPTNVQFKQQTPFGCTFVNPRSLDGATLYFQAGGKVLREYLFTDGENAYSSVAVSTLASHLLSTPIDMAVVHGAFEEAESYAAIVMSDGNIALFGSNRAEKRAGWTRITQGGDQSGFQSIVSIDDRLFVSMWEHYTSGAGVVTEALHLCEFNSGYYLDTSVQAAPNGSNVVALSGLFQTGETVQAIGYTTGSSVPTYIGQFSASTSGSSPSVTTEVVVTGSYGVYDTVEVGKSFTVALTTNPVDTALQSGGQTGDPRGVSSAVLDLVNTDHVIVGGYAYNPATAYTGKKETKLLGYSRDPKVYVTQTKPLRLQINGIIAELIV